MGKNYTVKEVAKKLRVSTTYVYNLIESGDLQKIEGLKGVIRIPSEELRDKFGNAGIRDYFQYDSTKVDAIETSLGKVRKIKNQNLYVLVDITKALALNDTYSVAKAINDKYVIKLTKEKAQEYKFFATRAGLLLISADGIKEYSTKSRNKSKVDKLIRELGIEGEVREQIQKGIQIIEQREVLGKDFKIYGTLENPLFLAKDVAEWIEHKNITHMMNTVDEDEKLTYTISNSGQGREMWFLTEDGLYEVLMQSRKPIAKQFKKQVKIILKQIRTTGGYIAKAPKFIDNYFSNFSIELRQKMISELETKINQLSIDKEKIDQRLLDSIETMDKIKSTLLKRRTSNE